MDQDLIKQTKDKMQKVLSIIKEDLGTIRTGRATPALVENVSIIAYGGTPMKLRELSTITTEGPRMIIIAPFDPSTIQDIEKGIQIANLGFSVSVDSNILRVNIPTLTAERREEFIKLAHTKIEGGRVMVRQARHEMMHAIKVKFDEKAISEDDKKRMEKEVQQVTDHTTEELDTIKEKKEQELREI